ncbi:hypothetical protein BGZ49_008304 [Haplosporangium sp. Z 27]|nr:hypothetical protein BGZ49_008304 [Haplosporangium sp. Z 27]
MLRAESECITSLDNKIVYPYVRRSDFEEIIHGTTVADPYRWLEDRESEETKAFVEAQTTLGNEFMKKFEDREKFHERLTELSNYERFGCPFKKGKFYYYFHNPGLQPQYVCYQQDSPESEPRLFLDVNQFSADGTSSLGEYSFSKSGSLFAYGISKKGSDWKTIYVKHTEGQEEFSDELQWVKWAKASFTHDDKGFFYSRYEKPNIELEKAGTETDTNEFQKVYYHRVGTCQSEDILVFHEPEHPKYLHVALVSHDGNYILIATHRDCDPVNRLYLIDFESEGHLVSGNMDLVKLVDNFDGSYEYITNKGTVFYFKTNKDAPLCKVIKYDLNRPQQGFVEVIPETDIVLSRCKVVDEDKLVLEYTRDVKSVLLVHDLTTGHFLYEIKIPVGTVGGSSGNPEDKEMFLRFSSFITPGTIYRYSFEIEDHEKRLSTFRAPIVKGFDNSLFETKQVFYSSKDGARIPMFITHKKGIVLDGNNPTILYGYGGFNISVKPVFSTSLIVFIQHMDGVAVHANLRGGGEYGIDWHKAGNLFNKQNVFDDFQWAAKYLINEKYTQPSRLAIRGGSNGGLLVGACLNQAPELFGCGVAQVGVMDMLRFHKFTVGHTWQSDYGNIEEDPEIFQYVLKYSPLHNVQRKHPYPAVALFTSTHDDRVVPLHSYKYIAELQHSAGSLTDKPLVLRLETDAGHGAGKSLTRHMIETTDMYSFIGYAIGARWTE